MNTSDEMATTWVLRMLGDFALQRDGEVVKRFGSRREDELLACLALDAGVPKHRDAIVETIWPGADRVLGRKRLSFSLFMLKKQFESVGLVDAIQSIGRSGMILDSRIVVDAQVFNAAIASASGASNASQILEQALSLYAGPLVPTCDSPWLVEYRQ